MLIMFLGECEMKTSQLLLVFSLLAATQSQWRHNKYYFLVFD